MGRDKEGGEMTIETPLTVADLVRALSKLPPDMELWANNPWDGGRYPLTKFPMDESVGLGVADGKLWLSYDATLLDGEPLDFGRRVQAGHFALPGG